MKNRMALALDEWGVERPKNIRGRKYGELVGGDDYLFCDRKNAVGFLCCVNTVAMFNEKLMVGIWKLKRY